MKLRLSCRALKGIGNYCTRLYRLDCVTQTSHTSSSQSSVCGSCSASCETDEGSIEVHHWNEFAAIHWQCALSLQCTTTAQKVNRSSPFEEIAFTTTQDPQNRFGADQSRRGKLTREKGVVSHIRCCSLIPPCRISCHVARWHGEKIHHLRGRRAAGSLGCEVIS